MNLPRLHICLCVCVWRGPPGLICTKQPCLLSKLHSLLPEKEMKVDQTSEDGGECGNEVICKVTSMYFDCTIDLRCEQCEEIFIVHHSEPGKCKNSADQREDG